MRSSANRGRRWPLRGRVDSDHCNKSSQRRDLENAAGQAEQLALRTSRVLARCIRLRRRERPLNVQVLTKHRTQSKLLTCRANEGISFSENVEGVEEARYGEDD